MLNSKGLKTGTGRVFTADTVDLDTRAPALRMGSKCVTEPGGRSRNALARALVSRSRYSQANSPQFSYLRPMAGPATGTRGNCL
jgi:hypothetical protein